MVMPPSGDVCCVCHERFRLPCQANCSHWFCGNCILRVWNSGFVLQPCKCPLCRRAITLLIPASTINEDHDREAYQVLQSIENYNRQFGRNPSLIQRFQDVPFFIRRLLREFMDPQRALPFVFRARTALSVLLSIGYVASPFDILSERIYGFVGFLDDFLVLVMVFIHLANMYRGLLLNRHGGA
ncbi:E3 ubiquitin-protein ligase RNF170-like isoform X1 [Zingiber officinale]|uniref:E3 ubiquitin-protein ligase RNF170-like isoform X1 n=1 Tax=Zingiber officinale TaxID=94328 RepID=UPI001C4C4281|nr:E3 ubiquitin-protein ligase RNF170-like isoform X1 [Zingiber officinale]